MAALPGDQWTRVSHGGQLWTALVSLHRGRKETGANTCDEDGPRGGNSVRTELLLRLGCSNQNRLKKHLQRWCLWQNHAGLLDPSTHPLQQRGLSVRVRAAREVSGVDGFSEAACRYQRLKVSAELHQ